MKIKLRVTDLLYKLTNSFNIKKIEDIYKIFAQNKHKDLLDILEKNDRNSHNILFKILKVENNRSNKALLTDTLRNLNKISYVPEVVAQEKKNIEENNDLVSEILQPITVNKEHIQKITQVKVKEQVSNLKYDPLSLEEASKHFCNCIKAYNLVSDFTMKNDPESDLSLALITFNCFNQKEDAFLGHLESQGKYLKIKLSNMAYRLIIANKLNTKNLNTKSNPYLLIKDTVLNLLKVICKVKEFQQISFKKEQPVITRNIDSNQEKLLENEILPSKVGLGNNALYKTIDSLIKETNRNLRSSIRQLLKLYYIKPNFSSEHISNIKNRFCPLNVFEYNKEYQYILFLLESYNVTKQDFAITCSIQQRKQIEGYLEELLDYFKLILFVDKIYPNSVDFSIVFKDYQCTIIKKPILEIFKAKTNISNTTFTKIIKALDYSIPYFQSLVITQILPKM